jgi:hypothetical protein
MYMQVDTTSHVVSRHSIYAARGPQDIISLVIPQNGDNTTYLPRAHGPEEVKLL